MNLSDHLETHPKEQVIKALVQMTIVGNGGNSMGSVLAAAMLTGGSGGGGSSGGEALTHTNKRACVHTGKKVGWRLLSLLTGILE